MRNYLLRSGVLVALSAGCALLMPLSGAEAACVTSGSNVTCTDTTLNGNGNNGFGDGTQNGLTINVQSGASVSGSVNGLQLDSNNTVINAGTISGSQVGIPADSANITNSGTISGGHVGIGANFANITNSGTISGGHEGIRADVANITNSGTISGGIFGTGILAEDASITNSGAIKGATGILADDNATLVNSGTIIGTGGTAIDFHQSFADSLTFLPGSRIQGAILLGAGDTVNVQSGRDVSTLLTFTPNGAFTVNGSGSAPFAVSGNQVATLDPTPFAMADRTLMDFTRGVSSIIGSAGAPPSAAAATAGARSAYAPDGSASARIDDAFASIPGLTGAAAVPGLAYADSNAIVFKNPTVVDAAGRTVWARGFVGSRVQQADGPTLHAANGFGGGAIGFDAPVAAGLQLGVFTGGGASRMSVDLNSGRSDTDTMFGGVYGRYAFASFGAASFLDFALHGGGSDNRASRTVASNLAAGGFETAQANYRSWYVSPELAYGVSVPLSAQYTLAPSVRVRYVAGLFDGYTESGSAANLTVAGRTISDVEERGEVKLTHAMAFTPSDVLLTSIHAGVLGIHRLGDTTVNTVLLGQELPFVTPGKANVAGLFGGIGFDWRTHDNVSFFGAAEFTAMSDSSSIIAGKGGVRVAF